MFALRPFAAGSKFPVPTTEAEAAELLGITVDQAAGALEALEGEGLVLRGRFRPEQAGQEWCHRRLLARIHRLTMAGLRREIEPVDVGVYLRYLHHHHGILEEARRTGTNGLYETIAQLQGIDLPAVCWERDVLPPRLTDYRGQFLDELCLTGEIGWGRLFPRPRHPEKSRPMTSITRIAPVSLFLREDRTWLIAKKPPVDGQHALSGSRKMSSRHSKTAAPCSRQICWRRCRCCRPSLTRRWANWW